MKKLIIILICIMGIGQLWAEDHIEQRLSPDEFRSKQQEFITQRAGLTDEEAAKFFPLYFELQDRKKQIGDQAWNMIRKGREPNVTEAQYGQILEKVYDSRIAVDRLDKSYLEKFRKILSNKKLYEVQKAELRFHRELLKNMQYNKNHQFDK